MPDANQVGDQHAVKLKAHVVTKLTTPHSAENMEAIPISSLVNSSRNDMPEILQPVAFTPPPPIAPRQTQGELF